MKESEYNDFIDCPSKSTSLYCLSVGANMLAIASYIHGNNKANLYTHARHIYNNVLTIQSITFRSYLFSDYQNSVTWVNLPQSPKTAATSELHTTMETPKYSRYFLFVLMFTIASA